MNIIKLNVFMLIIGRISGESLIYLTMILNFSVNTGKEVLSFQNMKKVVHFSHSVGNAMVGKNNNTILLIIRFGLVKIELVVVGLSVVCGIKENMIKE